MKLQFAAALALAAPSSLAAQGADLATATVLSGTWTYAATSSGSEASFTDSSGHPQLWVRCARATRRLSISKPADSAAPFVSVWTSSLTRGVPSSFDPATKRLTIDLAAGDPLFDAIASSRGRVGFTVGAQPALVVPPWAETARVIEDCRI